ncbi:hypothetical protein MXD95_007095 [Frankia sp. AiPa1]|nr:hypothetical protein [Frankia sp. AiPa1]MCL9759018.1 hypothetical protein [Frankia sp. AiPa1]
MLSPHPLEAVRMLTNHNMELGQPVRLLLVGQPTLRRRVKLAVLAAPDQRIAIHHHMTDMTREEPHRLHPGVAPTPSPGPTVSSTSPHRTDPRRRDPAHRESAPPVGPRHRRTSHSRSPTVTIIFSILRIQVCRTRDSASINPW